MSDDLTLIIFFFRFLGANPLIFLDSFIVH